MKPRHLLNWSSFSDPEIREILDLASLVKKNPTEYQNRLSHKTLVMVFQKTSTRTRVSFEAAMTELGGHAIFLDWNASNFALTEISYESAYLSRNSHVIMARMMEHDDLAKMASTSQVPVINGCCNKYHPCQALADMLTIKEHCTTLKGTRLTYIGVHNNIANSLMSVCCAFDVSLTLVCPLVRYKDEEIYGRLAAKGLITETLDAKTAVKNADFVYTDTWIDMEFFNDPSKLLMKDNRIRTMVPYQLNETLLNGSKAKVMHDMPIHPGYEITPELVESEQSVIFEQAENRLHSQKALLLWLLGQA